jgi:hypothetical protein
MLTGVRLTHTNIRQLKRALYAAGLSEFTFGQVFDAAGGGIPTFSPVTEEIAVKLGFLKEKVMPEFTHGLDCSTTLKAGGYCCPS